MAAKFITSSILIPEADRPLTTPLRIESKESNNPLLTVAEDREMAASLILGKGQDDVDIIGMSRSIHMRSLEKENKKKLKHSTIEGEPIVEYFHEPQ